MSKGLTSRSDDYSQWYNELVTKADLAEHSAVRGCMVIKPYGYSIWEKMQAVLDQKFKDFNVTKKGGYAIWQEGPLFKCAPMTFVYPQIINTDLQQLVKLSPSIGRASKNGFSRASMLMFYCELEVGNYRLDVMAGSSLNPIEEHVSQSLIKNLSIKQAPDSQYNVQIRESLTQKQRAIMFICLFAGLFLFIKGIPKAFNKA